MARFEDLLPEKTALEGIDSLRKAELTGFNLYRETTIVITVIAHSYVGAEDEKFPLSRNDAIMSGLLLRVAKFMRAVTRFAAERSDGEIIPALNRCIMESAVNLEYLVSSESPTIYDDFVEHSLGPERELFELITKNVADRGGHQLDIETRMLESIRRTCRASGKLIEDLNAKRGSWGGNFRERLEALDKGELYLSLQKLGSHSIHGTWTDLSRNYVEEETTSGKYRARKEKRPDARILTPVAYLVLDSVGAYVANVFSDRKECPAVLGVLSDLLDRLREFELIHEHFLSSER